MWALLAAFLLWQTDYIADGLKALDENRYEAAAQSFSKAIAAEPDDYAGHFISGWRIACWARMPRASRPIANRSS
jgi:hypothetical protein